MLSETLHNLGGQEREDRGRNRQFITLFNPQISKFCSIITSSNTAFSSSVKTISDEGIGCMGGTHFSALTFFKGDAKGD